MKKIFLTITFAIIATSIIYAAFVWTTTVTTTPSVRHTAYEIKHYYGDDTLPTPAKGYWSYRMYFRNSRITDPVHDTVITYIYGLDSNNHFVPERDKAVQPYYTSINGIPIFE